MCRIRGARGHHLTRGQHGAAGSTVAEWTPDLPQDGDTAQLRHVGQDVTGATSFLEVLTPRERGKLKLYIGSFAGVGKTYRMLTEAHELRRRGVDIVVWVRGGTRPD